MQYQQTTPPSMSCPRCGKAMLSGFIQSQHRIFWTEKPQKIYGGFYGDGEIMLGKGSTLGLRMTTIPAHRCPDCQWVLMDTSACEPPYYG